MYVEFCMKRKLFRSIDKKLRANRRIEGEAVQNMHEKRSGLTTVDAAF